MAGTYPSFNDREFDLLKKIASNSAELVDTEAGDVTSVAGTPGNILVNGDTAPTTGSVTLSLPPAVTGISSITAPAATPLTLSGGSSGATLSFGAIADGAIIVTPGSTTAENEYFTVNAATLTSALPRDTFALRGLLTVNSSTLNYHSAGILGQVITSASSAGLNQWLAGVYGYFKHNGTTPVSEAIGVTGVMTINNTGDVTEGAAFKSSIDQQTSTGRYITLRHYYAPPFTNTSAATKPTYLAVFEAADHGVNGDLATTVYAFRSLGNTPSSFSGPVTVGSLTTGSTIVSNGITNASGALTGIIQTTGGASISKTLWIGEQLMIDNTGTTSAKGIDFGNSAYIYRNQSGGIRIDTTNQLYITGDLFTSANATYDIGSSGNKWRHLFVSGTASVGSLSSSGAISIGNTVAAAVGVASTHKVTIVIGGTTYYLLATNVP